jgi:eukaryotic-like serine/threonine-protein kinase
MNKNIKRSFFFHLGIVLLLCTILYLSFFAVLHSLTRHGEELQIPDLRGKSVDLALTQLKEMHFEIIVDSTYEPSIKPLTVIKQVPDSGSSVKRGRTVFLTVNMLMPPYIPMPNLVSLSLRSAQMLLRNNKLMMGDTSYKADIAAGAILEQKYKGADIRPGEMIAQGSKISLVIGDGLGNTEFNVPAVTNMPLEEALTLLNQYNITPIVIADDQMSQITDTPSAIVVDQEPRDKNEAGAFNRIKEGDNITLRIQQNPSEHDVQKNNINPAKNVNDADKTKKPK